MVRRVPFYPPSERDFMRLMRSEDSLVTRRGGGLDDISVYRPPSYYRKGGGIFSFLANVGRKAIPFISKIAKPALLDFASNVIGDLKDGGDLKASVRSRGISALKNVGSRAMRGGGRRRVKACQGVRRKAKTSRKGKRTRTGAYKRDVFSMA